jgi:hypothetical protein
MSSLRHLRCRIVLCCLAVVLQSVAAQAQEAAPPRDGRHDFDFETGVWKTRLSRLQAPLSGATRWLEYEGTTVVRGVWEGRANLAELVATGPAGRIEALSLRLYNPESRQWSLNFANGAGGTLSPPAIGEFRNQRGEFYNQETYNGRAILVRFVISEITATSCRFEQAFSDDGGRTWRGQLDCDRHARQRRAGPGVSVAFTMSHSASHSSAGMRAADPIRIDRRFRRSAPERGMGQRMRALPCQRCALRKVSPAAPAWAASSGTITTLPRA